MKKIIFGVVTVFLVVLDQLFKFLVAQWLPMEYDTATIIPGVLNFTHIENDGAAFSAFAGQRWFIIILTVAIMAICLYFVFTNKIKSWFLHITGAMVVAGGLGNLIDRLFRGGLVFDYIDVNFAPFENFAVFNFADCLVVVGVILVIVGVFVEDYQENKKNKLSQQEGE